MDPRMVRYFDGCKYMWDGEVYASESIAREKASAYLKDKFEVRIVKAGNDFLIYTRRVVKEVVVEGKQS
jgi:hypothetical protein